MTFTDKELEADYRRLMADWENTRSIIFLNQQHHDYPRSVDNENIYPAMYEVMKYWSLVDGTNTKDINANPELVSAMELLMKAPLDVVTAFVRWASRQTDSQGEDYKKHSDEAFQKMWKMLWEYQTGQTKPLKEGEAYKPPAKKRKKRAKKALPKDVQETLEEGQTTLDEFTKRPRGRPRTKPPPREMGEIESEGAPYKKGPPTLDRKARRLIDEEIAKTGKKPWPYQDISWGGLTPSERQRIIRIFKRKVRPKRRKTRARRLSVDTLVAFGFI